MSAQDIVPYLTIPGSIIGIITGGFVIWERFFRYEPSAYITAKPLMPGGAQKQCYLRVINRSERPIILSWPNGTENDAMRLATDHSIGAIVNSLHEGEQAIALDGKVEEEFPVMVPPNWDQLEPQQTIEIRVNWHFAQPMIWKRHRSFLVRITKRSYQLLGGDDD